MVIELIANTFAKLFLAKKAIPEHFRNRKIAELPLLAIDLELTDLNTNEAKITSIAWVSGKMFVLDLSSAYYQIVRAKGDFKQSPIIHGLSAKDVAKGEHIREQMVLLRDYVKDYVWVFHNAHLDLRMINRVWRLLSLPPVLITYIDTMLLQVYVMEKTHGFVPSGEVTLGNSRAYYELPEAIEHNALDDAVATLTLLYAQLYQFDKSAEIKLTDLRHTRSVGTYELGKP